MVERLTAEQSELVKKNVELAHFLARASHRRNPEEVEIEEVVSVAYQGLVRAAQKFDPSRMSPETVANGKAFAGFARQKINGAILDWQREIDHVQRTYRQWYKQLQSLGYIPYETSRAQVKDYAEVLELEHEKLVLIIRAVENRSVSLDVETGLWLQNGGAALDRQDSAQWNDRDNSDIESDAAGNQITRSVQSVFRRLPDTQKAVITLRYYQHEEFQNISAELGISLTAVRNAHEDAIFALHRAMRFAAADQV